MKFKIDVKNESGKEYLTISLYKGKEVTSSSPSVNISWEDGSNKAAIAHMLESSVNNLLGYMALRPQSQ